MSKLVVLKLDGDLFEGGFKAVLEIGEDGQRPDLDMWGQLPADPHLAETLHNHWQLKYRKVGFPYGRKPIPRDDREGWPNRSPLFFWRIKPGKAIYDGHLKRIEECRQSALELEKQFQKWLRSEPFQPLDLRLREELNKEDDIRFVLRSDDRDVKKLPWHLWDFFRRYARAEVALSSLSSEKSKKSQLCFADKVRILAILGHREGIDIERDRQFLAGLPQTEVTFLVEPDRQQINDKLWEQPWDIIFFAGHSETEGETGKIYINPNDCLEMRDLWYGLRKAVANGLKLAIFNSCDGLGLAQRLDDLEIPVAIVMRELVPDKVAQEFLKYFLHRFVSGLPFHLAVREAREQLQGLENDFPCSTWLPVICQNSAVFPPNWPDFPPRSVEPPDEQQNVKPMEKIQSSPWKKYRLPIAIVCILVSIGYFVRPQIGKTLNNAAVECLEVGRLDCARSLWDLALLISSNRSTVLNNIGYAYLNVGETELAREKFQKAKLLGDPFGCNNDAFIENIESKYLTAEKKLRGCLPLMEAADSELGLSLIYKNLGWALLMRSGDLKTQDYQEAANLLDRAIDLNPNSGSSHCLLAQVLEKQERFSDAISAWQNCVQYANDEYPEESDWKKMGQQILETTLRKK